MFIILSHINLIQFQETLIMYLNFLNKTFPLLGTLPQSCHLVNAKFFLKPDSPCSLSNMWLVPQVNRLTNNTTKTKPHLNCCWSGLSEMIFSSYLSVMWEKDKSSGPGNGTIWSKLSNEQQVCRTPGHRCPQGLGVTCKCVSSGHLRLSLTHPTNAAILAAWIPVSCR